MAWPDNAMMVLCLFSVLLAAGGLLWGVFRTHPGPEGAPIRRGFTVGVVVWMALWAGFGLSGMGLSTELPFVVLAIPFMLNTLLAIGVAASPVGERLSHLPIAMLVGFQGFRLPLEITLHGFAAQDVVPDAMTWTGQNLDVITGVLAILLIPLAKRSKWLVLAFEVIGVALLLNVFRVVAMNIPGSPIAVDTGDVPMLIAAYTPINWIVGVCVFAAITGHVVIGRWLWREWNPTDEARPAA